MHEDITVCDNSPFLSSSGEIFTARTNPFLFPLLFLYLYKDSEEVFLSSVASHLEHSKQTLPED